MELTDYIYATDKVSTLAIDENRWKYGDRSANDDYNFDLGDNGVRGIDRVSTAMCKNRKQLQHFLNKLSVLAPELLLE